MSDCSAAVACCSGRSGLGDDCTHCLGICIVTFVNA